MSLILHIMKKDLRQTWMWVLAILVSIAGLGWAAYMHFHAPPADRNLWANALSGFALASLASAAVFLSTLVHAESLCGNRSHWLGRPIEWRHLFAAKALFATAATALPLALLMAIFLTAEGFSPAGHLAAIAWRTAVVITVWVLPLAALATITSSLQQMALWLVGLFAAFLLAASLLHARGFVTPDTLWIAHAASFSLVALLGIAIAVWQFARRDPRLARIALAAGVPLFLTAQVLAPRTTNFASQSPKGTLSLDAQRSFPAARSLASNWIPHIAIPVRVNGVGDTELATLDAIDLLEINAAGEHMSKIEYATTALRRAGAGTNYWLQVPIDPAFYYRHYGAPVTLRLRGQMTLHDNRRSYPVTTTTAEIPGAGRCQVESVQVLQVRCTAPFRIRQLLELFLVGTSRELAMNLQVHAGEMAPFDLQFHPIPVERFVGYIPATRQLLPTERIEISVAEPRESFTREFTVNGIRLEDYTK